MIFFKSNLYLLLPYLKVSFTKSFNFLQSYAINKEVEYKFILR